MSRILKRPMFKTGGSPNEGIMHGLVNRRGYSFGERVKQRKSALDEIYSSISMPKSRFPLGQIGLNLVSGEFAGDGFLSNVGRSVRGPYSEWTKEQDALDRMKYQLDVTKTGQAVSDVTAMDMARAKAAGQNGFLKKETTEGAFDHFLEENTKSANELERWNKPNLSQKYKIGDAEFKSYVWRNLKTTTDPQGQEIERNYITFVPFDKKNQEFEYDKMMPGAYYYDPRLRAFVQRVPVDGKDVYYKYDKMTFEKSLIQ